MLNRRRSEVVTLVCGLALVIVRPSRATGQIAAAVDEQGRTVYVNAILPEPVVGRHHRSWGSSSQHPEQTYGSQSLRQLARQAAANAAVDLKLVDAVIQAESEYNPHAVSPKGATGLMQLVPGTARRFGVTDPFDPAQNLEGGTSYLRYLLDLFGDDVQLALAAYNAGEGAVLRSKGVPPFAETRAYVRQVTALYSLAGEGPAVGSESRQPTPAPARPIYTYVDSVGVVHFTNE